MKRWAAGPLIASRLCETMADAMAQARRQLDGSDGWKHLGTVYVVKIMAVLKPCAVVDVEIEEFEE